MGERKPSRADYEISHLIGLLVMAVDDGDRRHALHLIRLMYRTMQPVDVLAAMAQVIADLMRRYEGDEWRHALDLSLLDIEATAHADYPDEDR